MTSPRKIQWKTLRRFAQNLVVNESTKLIRQLQTPNNQAAVQRGIERGIKIGMQVIATAVFPPPAAITAGRPVTRSSFPTAQRARKLVYAPDLAGRADPGEVVWTWVVRDEDPTHGEDRPVLVVGRDRSTLLGLTVSSDNRHAADPDWVEIGTGSWDCEDRPSWVRLDRVFDVPEEGIRREGAVLQRETFEIVAARLRTDYSWR